MGNLISLFYMLLVSRQVPVSQQYWRKRIGPSLADRSRVGLNHSFCLEDNSFLTLLLLPAGSAATKVHIII